MSMQSTNLQAPDLINLVCPLTRLGLQAVRREEAERAAGAPLRARGNALNARGREMAAIGVTESVMLRDDRKCAYPIVDGFAILLAPEMLSFGNEPPTANLKDPIFAEAYEEMDVYNEAATREAQTIHNSEAYSIIAPILSASAEDRLQFPAPKGVWIDAVYDGPSQWDAYAHIGSVKGRRVMQLGGKGIHAVKLLLAGAAEAWAVTPMLGEARCARALAVAAGVSDRLRCVIAVAEQMPFPDNAMDAIYSGGCLHHMSTELALPEASRILRDGGKFAAVDPWRAPLYAIGIKIFGKREKDVYCKPLDPRRIAPVSRAFRNAKVVHHGALTRYPMLALNKLGVKSSVNAVWRLNQIDDAVCNMFAPLRQSGSSIAVLGSK